MSFKVCCISDTHNNHVKLTIPECDILIHCGDFSGIGTLQETKSFLEWFSKQPSKHKCFISGNHDFLDYNEPSMFKELVKEYPNITYLRDEMVEIEGLKIFGHPWTPTFYDWAFMLDRGSPKMIKSVEIIPSNIDILISHGPVYGILDEVNGEHVGCGDLLNELERIKPKILVCGHLHSAHGIKEINGTKYINCAVLNDQYTMSFKPTIFKL